MNNQRPIAPAWVSLGGIAALGLTAVLIATPSLKGWLPAAPFHATAPAAAAETWTDDETTTHPDRVTGAALDARCARLWALFNAQDDIRQAEGAKPGFTPAYKSAERLEYATALQIRAQGCPLTDEATFDKELESIAALNAMVNGQ